MAADRLRRQVVRLSRRKLVARVLSLLLFVGAVLLALRLSHPPYPRVPGDRRRSAAHGVTQVEPEKDVLRVRTPQGTHRYRFYRSEKGVVARELEEGEK